MYTHIYIYIYTYLYISRERDLIIGYLDPLGRRLEASENCSPKDVVTRRTSLQEHNFQHALDMYTVKRLRYT